MGEIPSKMNPVPSSSLMDGFSMILPTMAGEHCLISASSIPSFLSPVTRIWGYILQHLRDMPWITETYIVLVEIQSRQRLHLEVIDTHRNGLAKAAFWPDCGLDERRR